MAAAIARLTVHIFAFLAVSTIILEAKPLGVEGGSALLLVVFSYVLLRVLQWGVRGGGPMGVAEGVAVLSVSLGVLLAPSYFPSRERLEMEAAMRKFSEETARIEMERMLRENP